MATPLWIPVDHFALITRPICTLIPERTSGIGAKRNPSNTSRSVEKEIRKSKGRASNKRSYTEHDQVSRLSSSYLERRLTVSQIRLHLDLLYTRYHRYRISIEVKRGKRNTSPCRGLKTGTREEEGSNGCAGISRAVVKVKGAALRAYEHLHTIHGVLVTFLRWHANTTSICCNDHWKRSLAVRPLHDSL